MTHEFTKSTDTKHEIPMESSVISANWMRTSVVVGCEAMLEVRTAFVGTGAPIEITAKTHDGTEVGSTKDKIRANYYRGTVKLKDDIAQGSRVYFEAKFPESGGVEHRSNSVPAMLPPKISNLKWSADEARREDILTLSADVKDVQVETECLIHIYEYDEDGAHDPITTLQGKVIDKKVEVMWEYEYVEDTDEIPSQGDLDPYQTEYRHPEYFFVVDVYGFRCGDEQESGLLKFKDFIEVRMPPEMLEGDEVPEVKVTLPDGSEQTLEFDDEGYAVLEDIPPGRCEITVQEK